MSEQENNRRQLLNKSRSWTATARLERLAGNRRGAAYALNNAGICRALSDVGVETLEGLLQKTEKWDARYRALKGSLAA